MTSWSWDGGSLWANMAYLVVGSKDARLISTGCGVIAIPERMPFEMIITYLTRSIEYTCHFK